MARKHTAIAVVVAIVLAATVLFLTAFRPMATFSIAEATQAPLSQDLLRPVEVVAVPATEKPDPEPRSLAKTPTPAPEASPLAAAVSPAPKVKATPKPAAPKATPKPKRVIASVQPPRPRTRHVVAGKASWYCSPSQPVCHHAYPPGSMVAAACGKLRVAMGGHADRFWRGKIVTVTANSGVTVTVKLVDWCGSTDKLIDLYKAPMDALGGTGVLSVTVRW